jgi:hypothetical protein
MPLLTSRLYSLSNKKSPHFFAVTTGSPRNQF